MQPNKLFVANISFEATEDTIRALFEEVGTVEDIYYARDHESGRPRGFAFVTMASEEEAQQAIERLHGHVLNERDLRVSVARPKEERPGGESRGGFRGGAPRAPRLNSGPRGGGYGGGREGGYSGGRGGYGGGGGRSGGFGGGGRGGRGGYGGERRDEGQGGRRPRRDFGGSRRSEYED